MAKAVPVVGAAPVKRLLLIINFVNVACADGKSKLRICIVG